jgi:DNA helicase HerA-like ATPase
MQLDAKRSCTLIVGKSGTGKSTLAYRYLVAERALSARFIFDPDSEAVRRLGVRAAQSAEELELSLGDGFTIFDPHALFPGNLAGAMEWFCGWCFKASGQLPGSKCLLIDEAWRYCSPGAIPAPLANCLQTGRKFGLGMMFVTQRPNRLNEAITNEATECVCFRLQGENALKRVADLGADVEEVAALPNGSFVALNVDSGAELRGRLW